MPVLGVIFLRHATNRYQTALQAIEADQVAGTMPKRPLSKADFIKRRALLLPEVARYDTLLNLPSGASLGGALVTAMNAIEAAFALLQGSPPKDYDRFDNKLDETNQKLYQARDLLLPRLMKGELAVWPAKTSTPTWNPCTPCRAPIH